MMRDVCKHCVHAACLEVCPTGAIIRTEFDTVYIQGRPATAAATASPPARSASSTSSEPQARRPEMHALLRPAPARPAAGLRPGLPDAVDPVRPDRASSRRTPRRGSRSCTRRARRRPASTAADDKMLGGLNAFYLLVDEPEVYGLPSNPKVPSRERPAVDVLGASAAARWRCSGVLSSARRRASTPPAACATARPEAGAGAPCGSEPERRPHEPLRRRPDWGGWIVAYFFLGGIAAGAYFLAVLIDGSAPRRTAPLARVAYWVAFPLICLCVRLPGHRPRPAGAVLAHAVQGGGGQGGVRGRASRSPATGWRCDGHVRRCSSTGRRCRPARGALTLFGALHVRLVPDRRRGRRWRVEPLAAIGRGCGTRSRVGRTASAGVLRRVLHRVAPDRDQPAGLERHHLAVAALPGLAVSTGLAAMILLARWKRLATDQSRHKLESADVWALGLEFVRARCVPRRRSGPILECGSRTVAGMRARFRHARLGHAAAGRCTAGVRGPRAVAGGGRGVRAGGRALPAHRGGDGERRAIARRGPITGRPEFRSGGGRRNVGRAAGPTRETDGPEIVPRTKLPGDE